MILLFWSFIIFMTLIAVLVLVIPIRKTHLYLSITLVFLLPLAALLLYWKLGALQQLENYWALKREAKQVEQALSTIKDPMQVVNQLKAYLYRHPNSPRGWYLLGKIYFLQGQYSKALAAAKNAYQQQPSNTRYAISYAEASFFQHNRRLTSDMINLLKKIITKEPNNVSAINLLAVNSYLRKDYTQAVKDWERLLPLFQVGSPDQKMLLLMIARSEFASKRSINVIPAKPVPSVGGDPGN